MSDEPEKLLSGKRERFFIDDPCVLFRSFDILPMSDMSKDEKLNAITRAVVLVSTGLYIIQNEYWFIFLIVALLAIVIFKFASMKRTEDLRATDENNHAGGTGANLKEDFTLVPTYQNPDLQTTTVAPLFAEEWQIYPPAYDLYTNTPPTVSFHEPLMPQNYPYGQYLTRTNLMPNDEQAIRMLNGGPKQARSYINNSFLRHELSFRDNMQKLYKKRLERRFRHNNTWDTFSPFHSY